MKIDLATVALLTTIVLANAQHTQKTEKDTSVKEVMPSPKFGATSNVESYPVPPYLGNSSVIVTIYGADDKSFILHEVDVPLKEYDTVIDVTARALLQANLPFDVKGFGRDATFTSVDNVSQKRTDGDYGWLYLVDGIFPIVPPALYFPVGNESIDWVYISYDSKIYPAADELFVKRENNLLNF